MYNFEYPTQVEFENREGMNDHGGSRQGSVEASFAMLESALGKPDFEGIGDNITTQFVVKAMFFDNNDTDFDHITFSLYDWHYSRNLNDNYAKTTWNVGGEGYGCVEAADLFIKCIDGENYLESIEGTIIDLQGNEFEVQCLTS